MNKFGERVEAVPNDIDKQIERALKTCVTEKLLGEHDDDNYKNEISRLTVHPLSGVEMEGLVIGTVKYQGQLQVIKTGSGTFTVRCVFINSKGNTAPFQNGTRENVTLDQLPTALADAWEAGYVERGRFHHPEIKIPHHPNGETRSEAALRNGGGGSAETEKDGPNEDDIGRSGAS